MVYLYTIIYVLDYHPLQQFFSLSLKKILNDIGFSDAYQDDIPIVDKDFESCKSILLAVLGRLDNYKVKINVEKSEYFVNS